MDKYKFGFTFQKDLVCLCVQEDDFIMKYRDVLSPSFLDNENIRFLIQIVLNYYDKYKKTPKFDTMQHLLLDFKGSFNEKDFEELESVAYSIYNNAVTERQFIVDKVVDFGQRQSMKIAIQKSIIVLKENKSIKTIQSLINEAMVVGSSRDLGMDFTTAVLDIPNYLKDDKIYQRIPTPWERINRSMFGGAGPGELIFVSGGPKYGKSTVLVEFAANAVLLGYPTLYVTLELKEVDVLIRTACRVFNFTPNQVLAQYHECLPAIKESLIAQNLFRIKFFPTKTLTVDNLRAYVSYLGTSIDFKPKVIVVDYADRLMYKGDDAYKGMGEVYDDLIKLGSDRECLMVTASQLGRGQYRDTDSDAGGISDSWLKFANCDLALIMRQTKEEKLCGLVRLFVAGARRGADSYEIPCKIDYEKYSVREIEKDMYETILGSSK